MKLKLLLALTLTLVLGLTAYFVIAPGQHRSGKTRIGEARKDTMVQRVTIAGPIEAKRSTVVRAPYEGYVRRLYVSIGQRVKKGDPLVSVVQSLTGAEPAFPIRAPFEGVVVQVLKTEGQAVDKGDSKDYILRVDDLSELHVNAKAPEIDIAKLKKGQKAKVKVSSITEETFSAQVTEMALAATSKNDWQSTNVEFQVEITLTEGHPLLKPGMSAIVDVLTNQKENALLLDHEFIHKSGDQYYVLLENGKRQDIKVGIQNETSFEVLEGLSEHQRVRQVDFLANVENT